MRTLALAAALGVILSTTGAVALPPEMTVREFLRTADGIPRNPTALLRSDTRRLMGETRGAFRTVREEQTAARAAGRRPATCMPERVSISAEGVLARLNAVPEARRNISVTQAVREWMAAEHPCPAV